MTGVTTNMLFGGPAGAGGAGQHHRGAGADGAGQVFRRDPVGDPRRRRSRSSSRRSSCVPVASATSTKARADDLRRGDRADRGEQGQVVRRRSSRPRGRAAPQPARRCIAEGERRRRSSASRSRRSCSRATPAWARARWARRVLRNKIKKAGIDGVTVVNKAIANLDRRRRPGDHAARTSPSGRSSSRRTPCTSRSTTS